jgi:hypothetical protein
MPNKPTGYTQELLAAERGSDPDNDELYLIPLCHESAKLDICYMKSLGTLFINCRKCGKEVARFLIASQPFVH